jgi:hypothetical protein
MAKGSSPKKSLTDQIVEETLAALDSLDEFDPETIEQLVQLAAQGDMKKATQIAKIIKPA